MSALLYQLKSHFPLIPHDVTGNSPFVSLLLVSSSYNQYSSLFSAQFRSVNLRCCWTSEQKWAASMSWFLAVFCGIFKEQSWAQVSCLASCGVAALSIYWASGATKI